MKRGTTVAAALENGATRLHMHGAAARHEAGLLLTHFAGRTSGWLLAHDDAVLDRAVIGHYESALARRAAGEPIAYILGEAGFYGRKFRVTPDVLVPRPESEQLITLARDAFAGTDRPVSLCDVGTGSGVIAITLAAELPQARIVAIDCSGAALTLAAANAAALGVAPRIAFRRGDTLAGLEPTRTFDAIIANLPYVRTDELPAPPDPTSFEPRVALDGGCDGLAAYRKLLERAPRHLTQGGIVIMEAGPDTAGALETLARRTFDGGVRVGTVRDYAGLLRVVCAQRKDC